MTSPERAEQGPSRQSRRRMATWLIAGFGLILLLAGVVVSFITGTPFSWAGFLLIGGVICPAAGGWIDSSERPCLGEDD